MPSLRANQAEVLALSIETEVRMSSPQLRRADRVMPEQRACEMLARGFSGQLATVGEDGLSLLHSTALHLDGRGSVRSHQQRQGPFPHQHRPRAANLL